MLSGPMVSPSMRGQSKTSIFGLLKELAEGLGAGPPLIAANPDAHDAGPLRA